MAELREARDRCFLHVNKLEEFTAWATSIGYERVPTKGIYEVLRLQPKAGPVLIWWKRDRSDHATSAKREAKLVRRWFGNRKAEAVG